MTAQFAFLRAGCAYGDYDDGLVGRLRATLLEKLTLFRERASALEVLKNAL